MAAFSLGRALLEYRTTHSNPFHPNKPTSRAKSSTLCCRSHLPVRSLGASEEKMEKKGESKEERRWWALLVQLYGDAEKLWRGLRERRLSPKQKGDWKDLVLMSLSFAVYVYISQKIVCAYCAWMSMPNHF